MNVIPNSIQSNDSEVEIVDALAKGDVDNKKLVLNIYSSQNFPSVNLCGNLPGSVVAKLQPYWVSDKSNSTTLEFVGTYSGPKITKKPANLDYTLQLGFDFTSGN
ncbi:hypothetical protein [Enterococcus bulliens]